MRVLAKCHIAYIEKKYLPLGKTSQILPLVNYLFSQSLHLKYNPVYTHRKGRWYILFWV
jgi:hypothetical protein